MNIRVSMNEVVPPIPSFHDWIVQVIQDYTCMSGKPDFREEVHSFSEKDLEFMKHKLTERGVRHRLLCIKPLEIDWTEINREIGNQFTEPQKEAIRAAVERQLRK